MRALKRQIQELPEQIMVQRERVPALRDVHPTYAKLWDEWWAGCVRIAELDAERRTIDNNSARWREIIQEQQHLEGWTQKQQGPLVEREKLIGSKVICDLVRPRYAAHVQVIVDALTAIAGALDEMDVIRAEFTESLATPLFLPVLGETFSIDPRREGEVRRVMRAALRDGLATGRLSSDAIRREPPAVSSTEVSLATSSGLMK